MKHIINTRHVVWGAPLLLLFVLSCGGKSGAKTDGGPGDGDDDGGLVCKAGGADCTAGPECCSNVCGADSKCGVVVGECEIPGGTCISGADCCSGLCSDDGSGALTCGAGYGACQALGESCDTATDCCSLGCTGGVCDSALCSTDGQACVADSDCCSNLCNADGTCEVQAGCLPAGEACGSGVGSTCCSANCTDFGNGETRCGSSGACRVVGEICTASEDCCGFNCVIGEGETYGQCETLPGFAECKSVGEACTEDTTCCSFTCRDNGTGFTSCQYLSGCRPMGELCRKGADCCNYAVQPNEDVCSKTINEDVGRCQNPGGDAPDGEVCGTEAGGQSGSNTCAPGGTEGMANCLQTSVGTYRCDSGDGVCLGQGESCALGDQCCSGICAPDANGDLVCDPVDQCRETGETCTANGDCCSSFCDPQTLLCATGTVID